jgi:spore maturation protein CgeB
MRILFLQNLGSRYGVLEAMTTDLCAAFSRQGVESYLFDAWEKGPSKLLQDIYEWKPDYTFGINLFAHKELPFETYGIPHLCLCVDAFHNYKELAEEETRNIHTAALFVDAWSSDLYQTKGGISSWFPHAISKEFLDAVSKKSLTPLANRLYDIVLLGSSLDFEREFLFWKQIFSSDEIDSICDLVTQLLENAYLSFQHELLTLVNQHPSLKRSLQKHSLSLSQFISSVELYMRGLDRKRLLKAFQGHSIHIFGEGWDPTPDCIIHPPLPFSSLFDICTQAKVILNNMPMIRRGYHERLFLGLASGAIVVTTKLNQILHNPPPSLIEYTSSSLPSLPGQVNMIKEVSPPLEWLRQNHTWDVRVKTFLPWFIANKTFLL